MKNAEKRKIEKGAASLYVAVIVLAISLAIVISVSSLVYGQQKIVQSAEAAGKAYFAAESGIEDALLRMKNNPMTGAVSYNFGVGQGTAQIAISGIIGGSRTITSTGSYAGRVKKIQVVYQVSTKQASFYYGAEIGNAGLVMENNSTVNGNIFSNGNVNAQSGSRIEGTVKVAGLGKSISGATISGNAYVDTCDGSEIAGELNALSESGCSYGAFNSQSPPEALPLPIPQEDIDQWKQEAQNGGIIGTQSFSSGSRVMGPSKIEGNLTVDGSAILILDGTLWVTGNINIANNAQVQLSGSYGSLSGVIVADGVITIQNNSISSGSGSSGSYLMYLSTAAANPALIVKNNAIVDIVYTSNGWIQIENNAVLRQITGYGILVKNNAEITYEIGLADVDFTSGPGGSWEVTSWKEIE